MHLMAARVPKHYLYYLFIYLFTVHYNGKLQLALYPEYLVKYRDI